MGSVAHPTVGVRGEHVDAAVPSLADMPDLQVLKDGIGEFDAGAPAVPVE
jgi:hypothetical protein